jgi:hypothetical protein
MSLHADPLRSAAHENMFAHLSGPFTGGAVETKLVIDPTGAARVDWKARFPLLLVSPKEAVGAEELSCIVRITQSSGEIVAPVTVHFAPYTEAGASVLAYRADAPAVDLDFATPFDALLDPGAGGDPAVMRDLFELRVIEGNLARLLYIIGAEKMRLRRQTVELCAARRLAEAKGDALNRIGAELGVSRFNARLTWDGALGTPTIVPAREADTPYRARLGIYRPFLRPSLRAVENLVNGPGTGNNEGLPLQVGVTARLGFAEPDTELLVAVRLVSSPDDTQRLAFLNYARDAFLLQPGTPVPDTRLLPSTIKQAENALRTRLADRFEFPTNAFIAPMLCRALDLVGQCCKALGVARKWRVLRTQDDAGGSRYELGLGVDLEVPPAAELDTMIANHVSGRFDLTAAQEAIQLLPQLQPQPSADDPRAQWLLAPCGVSTVHPLDAAKTYVSHLVLHGLTIGKHVSSDRTFLDAILNAPFDSGPDAVLVLALRDADVKRADLGIPPTMLLTGDAEHAAWALAAPPPPPLVQSMTDARIHMVTDSAEVQAAGSALLAVPRELVGTLQLEAAFAARLLAHDVAAAQSMLGLVIAFQNAGIASILPMFTSDNRVLLVVGVTALPGDATLLTARWKTSLRWNLVSISGRPGRLERKIDSRNEWVPEEGLAAVLVVAAGRRGSADPRGRVDPLEFRALLEPGVLVDLEQYEFLMNLLEHVNPLGVIADTRGVRNHIDADGDGTAELLSPRLAHTFRPYRQLRHVGASGVDSI